MIPEGDWHPLLDIATREVGEQKDAPIMAAYLLDEVDILVTSNTTDFPLTDYETILTPRDFLDTYDIAALS